jgi:spore maturation protein CgeB
MHIGLIGGNQPDGFQANISDSLRRMGQGVTYLGSAIGRQRGGRLAGAIRSAVRSAVPPSGRRLVRTALERECEAVITVQGDLAPEAVAALRHEQVPVALWFPDAVCNLGRQAMLAAPYTALFFKEPLMVHRLRDTLGIPVFYLPEACNPHWHRPLDAPAKPAIAVVGNLYPSRVALLRRLYEAGIPLAVHSGSISRWARSTLPPQLRPGPPAFREEKSRVFRGAVAVLNNLHPAEMHGVNARLFEAAAAGGAVLCERRPVLGDLFDLGTEVVPFGEFTELVAGARELLAAPELAVKIGDAASRRAHAEHTYEHRLPAILERLA